MLDSANFNTGPVTIDKSIKILAIPGEVGSIVGNGGDGLVINAPGKDVTLHNLVVLNLANGINGVRIVDARTVHLEKLAVRDFTSLDGACINYAGTHNIAIWVNDSILRNCWNAIAASGAMPALPRASLVVDNTRVEDAPGDLDFTQFAINIAGCIDLTVRNSTLSRTWGGLLYSNNVAGCNSTLLVADSTFSRAHFWGIKLGGAANNGSVVATVRNTQIVESVYGIEVKQSTQLAKTNLDVVDSVVSRCSGNCLRLEDTQTAGAGYVQARVFNSTLAHAGDAIFLTQGTPGNVLLTLTRSHMHNAGALLFHGAGSARFDACHMESFRAGFVNLGSNDVVSMGNNTMHDVLNPNNGTTYITPTVRAPI